jgi:hypothetical protein
MTAPTVIDESLKEWASESQGRYIDAVIEHGSIRAASRAIGVNFSTVRDAIRAAQGRAALKGFAPGKAGLDGRLSPAESLKGRSILHDLSTGEDRLVWIKTDVKEERRAQIIREMVAALAEDVKGLAPLTKAPSGVIADLLAVYPFGDPHFGMYAWAKEVGDDFDLDIARRLTLGAVDRLVQASPPAETAILLPLGDIFHMDDQTNRTPGHGHQLDADGRFVKVLHVGIQTFRHAVLRCLEKHKRVIVRFVQGNHDPHAVWALAFSIAAYFENDARVEVDLSPAKHWFYRFGKVLIGATHGDTTKPEQLLGVMAADRAEDWGQTKHRYWYTGHVHHQSVREFAGVTAESFRTLAAKDAYAAGHGYRAGRDMRLIVHHREHGEIERHRCDVGMLEPA